MITDKIYTDVKKGNLAKDSDLNKIFNTSNYDDQIKNMLDNGEYSLTTEERRKKVSERKKEIISYILKNYTDIKNNKLTSDIIEEILKKIKYTVDPHINGSKQARDLIKKFSNTYPIKKISINGILNYPNYYQESLQKILPNYTHISSSKITDDKYVLEISISPGDFDEFINILQKNTNGDFEFNVCDQFTNINDDTKKEKKGKKRK